MEHIVCQRRTEYVGGSLPSVLSLGVVHVYILSTLDSRCTRLRWQEEVNRRLCAPAERGTWFSEESI